MDRRASFELSVSFLVKLILGIITFFIISSFFTDKIFPAIANMPVVGKILMIFAILVIYDNLAHILMMIGINQV